MCFGSRDSSFTDVNNEHEGQGRAHMQLLELGNQLLLVLLDRFVGGVAVLEEVEDDFFGSRVINRGRREDGGEVLETDEFEGIEDLVEFGGFG
jgi:hypothetical protein